jgi:ubiquinone/menaquinone biosynthesis C-methylase UbiE
MRRRLATLAVAAALAAAGAVPAPPGPTHGRLFPPEDLGILESPDREAWQEPERIMDALGIADGSRVADIGAGGGWFTVRLARRVGPNGRVYAEDVRHEMIQSITQRVANQGLRNVVTILGTTSDPHLPAGLDAVLVVDTYPYFSEADRVPLLQKIGEALAPHGRLGIVDFKPDGRGGPGPPLDERLDPEVIKRDAARAGLRLIGEETTRYQYVLIFGRADAQ